jgi:hypothetical protein
MFLNIFFHDLPSSSLIPNFFAGRADRQQALQHLYLIESLLEISDRLF